MQKMGEDIEHLIEAMKAQYQEMRDHYDQHLHIIESEFERERTSIL